MRFPQDIQTRSRQISLFHPSRGGIAIQLLPEAVAKITGVQIDHLYLSAVRAEDPAVIGAGSASRRVILGNTEKIKKDVPTLFALGVFLSPVVQAVVVVVVGAGDGSGFHEPAIAGLGELSGIFRPEGIHVVGVAIYIISAPDPELGPLLQDAIPEFGCIVLMIAGAESDGGQRRLRPGDDGKRDQQTATKDMMGQRSDDGKQHDSEINVNNRPVTHRN